MLLVAALWALSGISSAQAVGVTSYNYNYNQLVDPGSAGSTTGVTDPGAGHANTQKYPRTWMNPMILPSVTSPVFNNTPTQWSRMRTDLNLIFAFKNFWYEIDLNAYSKRPGKVNVSYSFLPSGPVAPAYVLEVENLGFVAKDPEAFRRSFVFCGDVSIDGFEGADSQKIWGDSGEIARANGADLLIPINSGGTFKLDEKTIQRVFGISMGAQSGGTGSAFGIVLGYSKGTATHASEVKTLPFFVGLCFRKTGVPYRPVAKKPVKQPAPQAKAEQEEVPGVPDADANGFQRKKVGAAEIKEYQQQR